MITGLPYSNNSPTTSRKMVCMWGLSIWMTSSKMDIRLSYSNGANTTSLIRTEYSVSFAPRSAWNAIAGPYSTPTLCHSGKLWVNQPSLDLTSWSIFWTSRTTTRSSSSWHPSTTERWHTTVTIHLALAGLPSNTSRLLSARMLTVPRECPQSIVRPYRQGIVLPWPELGYLDSSWWRSPRWFSGTSTWSPLSVDRVESPPKATTTPNLIADLLYS